MAAANPFTLIVPTTINNSNLVSTTAVQIEPAYDGGTTYNTGDRAAYDDNIYQSLVGSNLGNQPDISPTQWALVSATNPYKMFDNTGSTITTGSSPLEWVFTGDMIDSVAFLEMGAVKTIRVQAYTPADGTYYDETYELKDGAVLSSWYDYFFSPILKSKTLTVTDIPPISGSTYTMTLSSEGDVSDVSIGTFIAGSKTEFGFTEYNATIGITDYSRKVTDEFGNVTLNQRKFAKTMEVKIAMPTGVIDSVASKLAEVRSSIILWVAAKDLYDSLTVYGYYQDFSIDVAFESLAYCTLDIEGIA